SSKARPGNKREQQARARTTNELAVPSRDLNSVMKQRCLRQKGLQRYAALRPAAWITVTADGEVRHGSGRKSARVAPRRAGIRAALGRSHALEDAARAPAVSHIVDVAAIIAQAASTALPPCRKVRAPAVAASGLPVTAIQFRPCSGGLTV